MGIGYCEGLCGGLLSHDLVGGLCPQCRNNPAIRLEDEVPLGAEADVRHTGIGEWEPDPGSPSLKEDR